MFTIIAVNVINDSILSDSLLKRGSAIEMNERIVWWEENQF